MIAECDDPRHGRVSRVDRITSCWSVTMMDRDKSANPGFEVVGLLLQYTPVANVLGCVVPSCCSCYYYCYYCTTCKNGGYSVEI